MNLEGVSRILVVDEVFGLGLFVGGRGCLYSFLWEERNDVGLLVRRGRSQQARHWECNAQGGLYICIRASGGECRRGMEWMRGNEGGENVFVE